jgi:hypothetical protein
LGSETALNITQKKLEKEVAPPLLSYWCNQKKLFVRM